MPTLSPPQQGGSRQGGAHQQLPCSPLLGKETSKLQQIAAFLGDRVGAWGSRESRVALLGLPPSPVQKRKGAPTLGGYPCTQRPNGGEAAPHTLAQHQGCCGLGACSRHRPQAAAGHQRVQLPVMPGSTGNCYLEASNVLSPIPPTPKHRRHQEGAGKGQPCWHLMPFQPLPVHPLWAAAPRY